MSSSPSRLKPLLVIAIVLAGIMTFGGLTIGAVFVLSRAKPPDADVQSDDAGEVIARLKKSTVYVRCDAGPGQIASGSGFFVGEQGYVLTNAHVVGYLQKDTPLPRRIEVVVDSGLPSQKVHLARVFAVDEVEDLALLHIEGPTPAPLHLGSANALRETDEVLIVGYPFGEQLGRNVSINKSSVSSLRRERRELVVVQLSGGMNPGNSGGPVANTSGEVIGVSVAKLRGAEGIDFAIPAERAQRFIEEQIRLGGNLRPPKPGEVASPLTVPPTPAPPPAPKTSGESPGIAGMPSVRPRRLPIGPVANFSARLPTADVEVVTLLERGNIHHVEVGRNGRYLFFLLSNRNIAVFDVEKGTVVKQIAVKEEYPRIAAGADRLIVIEPELKRIVQWRLSDFSEMKSSLLPETIQAKQINQICMGSASSGPLFVRLINERRTLVLDLETMEETDVDWATWAPNREYGPSEMRVSPDGTRLIAWGAGKGKDVCELAFCDGYRAATSNAKIAASDRRGQYAYPTADGRQLLTPFGLINPLSRSSGNSGGDNSYFIPAMEPGFYLRILREPEVAGGPVNQGLGPRARVFNEDNHELFHINGLDELKYFNHSIPWDKRVFYYPTSGLLITIPFQKNRLNLRKVDLVGETAQFQKNGYAFVKTRPPVPVPGKTFEYKLGLVVSRAGHTCKLLSGPPGMSVTGDGQVNWKVPIQFRGPVEVVIVISQPGPRYQQTCVCTGGV
jgi:S1-C subfamily serine protease